ncbi:MAG TPA: fibronectin type III domain-containing protein [Anaeromyxobacteraceae bacterium]|nr:fibronectin type III domain-containing protein [Anaeromyxobacteraceae bacterium]
MILGLSMVGACGGGGEDNPTPPTPPAAPGGVLAAPGDGAASVAWSASAEATSYNVYYATSPSVTTASPKVTASGSPASVPGLVNGTPYWFAVTAVGAGGESALSTGACAVPTAASQAGLSLRDGLCGTSFDGGVWWPNGLSSARVSSGAAELSTRMDHMEPFATNGAQYVTIANVNPSGARVTTLRGTIQVPTAAALSGADVQARASFRLIYSPPGNRLNFPRANQDLLNFEVGLIDLGSGLKAFRQVNHCDNASCSSYDVTGVTFADPAGWVDAPATVHGAKMADAAYGTTYTVEVRLAEAEGTTGVFHWSISGGGFGAGVSGAADPAAYLAGAAGWSGISLSGTGFQTAQMAARTSDRSGAGGGSGRITARFGDVWVGTNDQGALPFDDFSGASGNSGPTELSLAKWSNGGARSVAAPGGALAMTQQATSTGPAASMGQPIILANPSAVNAFQADLRVASYTASASVGTNSGVRGRFYNDGTAGAMAGSAVGDILALVVLRPPTQDVSYLVARCLTPTCSGAVGVIETGVIAGVSVGTSVHNLLVKWDPTARRFTLGVDGTTVEVDPTVSAPVAGPANAPLKDIFTSVGLPPTAGAGGSVDVRVNNVFTGP